MDFKVGDIICLPNFPYKPFKVTYVSNSINEDIVIITPVCKFENRSFRTFTSEELNDMGYVLYIKYMKCKGDTVLVPVICGDNKYKNLVYKKTNNPDNEYEYQLVGEE